MAKVRNLSDTQQQIAFTEHDFYQRYVETFKTSELGRIKSLLPLREMAISFGTQKEHYGLRKVAARIKSTEIMLIFFGIHTANVVNLARREAPSLALAA